MARFFHPLILMLASLGKLELARQVQYLKAENEILRAKLPKRVIVTPTERRRLLKLGQNIGPAIKHLITIVTYRTFLRWLAGDKAGRTSGKRGRPRTDEEIREIIIRLAKENGWGYTRILGELKKLGIRRVCRSAVINILKENGLDPGPQRGEGSWDEFTDQDDTQTREHNAANETGEISGDLDWIDPAYDDAGNMIVGPAPGDGETEQRYVYDAWNRLVQVTDDEDVVIATYRYDGLGRRIQKLLGPDPEDPTATYDYFYNESWQVVEVRLDGAPDPLDQYVWDVRYIDTPVVRFHDSDTDGNYLDAEDNILYYTTDANMNVTALVDAETGEVVERYMYDPYGKATVCDEAWTPREGNASAVANDVLYCGYRFDPESGLYHVRRRYYHATVGKWMSRDPVGYDDAASLYAYCHMDPTRCVDPSGRKSTVNIWDEGIGHSSLSIGDSSAGGTEDYVSVWPAAEEGTDPKDAVIDQVLKGKDDGPRDAAASTYSADKDSERQQEPKRIVIECLNEKAMLDEWKTMKEQIKQKNYKFHLIGQNCTSAVARVLWAGVDKTKPTCPPNYVIKLRCFADGFGEMPGADCKTNLKKLAECLKKFNCKVYYCACDPDAYRKQQQELEEARSDAIRRSATKALGSFPFGF